MVTQPVFIEESDAQVGDLVFAHSPGLMGRAIRLGERIKKPWRKGSRWNHVAIVDLIDRDGKVYVIQAEAKGVTNHRTLEQVAPGGELQLVANNMATDDVAQMMLFARGEVGAKYGWLTILAIVVAILTPDWFTFRRPGTWICSALVAESLRCGAAIVRWPDIYEVTPAQVWEALGLSS